MEPVQDKIHCPSIVFKVKDGYYAINSEYILSIMQLPKYEKLPDAPPNIIGIFTYRDEVCPMFDLRSAFGMQTLAEEYHEFAAMLEARKQDHIHWVEELERSTATGEKFCLATDPHQCAFGRWYDNYQSNNNMIDFHLRKIDDPHKKLHNAAIDVEHCTQNCDECNREVCLKEIFDRVKKQYMPSILQLLDESKELFKSAYHEMVLVLNGEQLLGLVVDEVLSVEDLEQLNDKGFFGELKRMEYITGVKRSSKIPGLILELNEKKLREVASAVQFSS